MNITKMTDLDLRGKRVLIREDLNVPIKNGKITSEALLEASLPTITFARNAGASVLVLSHMGRPTEGTFSEENSLKPVASRLSELLSTPVALAKDYINGIDIAPGQVVLCENVRFNHGEKSNCDELGKKYASLCDIFVMDAFGTAHRAQASTHAVAIHAPTSCAGPLLVRELEMLEKVVESPATPYVAIIGGSKVSTKLTVLHSLSQKVNTLIVGGGIANNFLKAAGFEVGKSLYEPDLVHEAKSLMDKSLSGGAYIPIPLDVVVSNEFSECASATIKDVQSVTKDDMILDIGPKTAQLYEESIMKAATIMWNGPLGAFEFDQFGKGTESLGKAIAKSGAFSIAGGGDTLFAVEKYGLTQGISYLSTGGGAFLEFLEGKTLPAVSVLESRCKG